MSKYTLEAGRCIVRDGIPFATIHGVGAYSPTELDQFARLIVARATRAADEERILEQAREILMSRMGKRGAALNAPSAVRDYLRLTLATLEAEEFWCLFLDAKHRVIAAERMFTGTLSQISVYPREVVKAGLRHNAGAVIFAHNHPSGVAEPSHADEILTRSLKTALDLVDIKVLDHFIVAGNVVMSFAERGLL